jgi:hypothetical protein
MFFIIDQSRLKKKLGEIKIARRNETFHEILIDKLIFIEYSRTR